MEKENKQYKANASESNDNAQNATKDSGFWDDAVENISEGAKVVSEEAREMGQKIASYSEVLFGKIKDNTQEAFKYGLDLTQEGVQQAQEVAEQFRDDIEIRKLNNKKKEVGSQLGIKIYLAIKNNDNHVPRDLISDNDLKSLLKELEKIDKEILKHSKKQKS